MILAVVFAVAAAMVAIECLAPGRRFPRVRGWWPRAALLNAVQVGVAWLATTTWDVWFSELRPFDADRLGTAGGAALGYFVITFVYYWWHRWRHEVRPLWRWIHQVHHSPQRIEIITSFYKHPLEIAINGLLSSAILYFVVGLGPAAASWAILITGLAELLYHWNIKTPYWLGFLVQRPESHCVHHQQGLHSFNYADLPLWDMLFGTFRNPRQWDGACGFADDCECKLGAMLRGVEVD